MKKKDKPIIHAESKCKRCSDCCKRKIGWRNKEGAIIPVVLDINCPALDEKTKLCRIYKWRHSNLAFVLLGMNQCLTVDQAIHQRALPNGCPYTDEKYSGMTFDPAVLAKYRQAKLGDYMQLVGETRVQRKAIDTVLGLMEMMTKGKE